MVVCKCRKATKLYCFVHKVPVCGECVCSQEHQTCVVRTYSEWVIDGEYDWPPKCCQCLAVLDEGCVSQTTRLGCLHVLHTSCLVSHIKSYPTHTAPAGFVCPSCSTMIWPPKSFKDSGSQFYSQLKDAITKTGMEKNLFGNHPVTKAEPYARPSGGPTDTTSLAGNNGITGPGISRSQVSDIVEIDVPGSAGNFTKSTSPTGPGATTRKGGLHSDRQNSETSYYADDEDRNRKKYSRRGPIRHKFLRALLPFWSNALPTLPVTAPSRKDGHDDSSETRVRHQKSSRMDPRKILLVIAIMACLATMGILYYRIAQRGFGHDRAIEDEQ
ncbi:hypothetical protein MLD38_013759 [Melastoma candidum]|uniref:Uncharacterized protein n=1 Tax=Melastoma candidum TaxID=119954 RepID=A0ACB9REA2_9MYRT|nr:hypothetical protein MLD38_013759 [Melastoma candidum]